MTESRVAMSPIDPMKRTGLHALPPPGTMTKLHPRHRLMIECMVYGIDRPHAALPDIPCGEPLDLYQAALYCGYRRRIARRLAEEPIFKAELANQIHAMRTGAKPKAVRTMINLMDHTDDKKPTAAAKVRLDASKAVLGEDSKGVSVTVNNSTTVGVAVKAGYVIRTASTPSPQTIEHE